MLTFCLLLSFLFVFPHTHTANYFMNCFLSGTKSESVGVRASSLSNLAEMCKILRFALQPFIRDIIVCVTAMLTTEKEVEVRRGNKKQLFVWQRRFFCTHFPSFINATRIVSLLHVLTLSFLCHIYRCCVCDHTTVPWSWC